MYIIVLNGEVLYSWFQAVWKGIFINFNLIVFPVSENNNERYFFLLAINQSLDHFNLSTTLCNANFNNCKTLWRYFSSCM